ncbi:cache domain-containing protein [Nodosilinea sp. PGN35]|uniref:HAMP domain-containing protein n=1 Tax=Nodosilinea sp. PGN35 TaxID=3020489 RepID=UPI0023B296E8|nr:cache domain-containing protein [Nodosilinea sp. TSF1-S3]MDF0367787.1 cache domain-containing protein [Nodosilinea sp. TSF1-S3]
MPFPSPRLPGLKATLVSAMLLTVGTTAALVYVPWFLVSRRNIATIVDQVNQEILLGTSQEVNRLFSNAESAQGVLVSGLEQGLVDSTSLAERERFFLSVLQANPNFTWVLYGEANGDFLGAMRTGDGQLEFHIRNWDPATRTTVTTIDTYQPEARGFTPLGSETYEMNPAFYTPDRPWYSNAVAVPDGRAWTVYVYRTTQEPGLGATRALLDENGQPWGAIGVSVGLKQLSAYLQRLQGDRPGEAFIVNAEQQLIASTDLDEAMPVQGDNYVDLRLQQLDAVENPLLRLASQTLRTEGVSLEDLGNLQQFQLKDPTTGERYLISFTPLGQLDWVVGTVIPESLYLSEVNRGKRLLLGVITIFTGLTAGAAVLMADRLIARPVLGIARTAADIESERFELGQLEAIAQRTDEIGQLARVFDRMAQQVYSREQKLKQQVRDLRIEIDEAKRQKQVQEIVDTDFFQDLTVKAQGLRDRSRREANVAKSKGT